MPLTSHHPFALVVDDDATILMAACEIIENAGFQALEARNADEALALLQDYADQVQLLFTDVQMPGTRDGFALARETALRWPEIKILIASGRLQPGPNDIPVGAQFISKPFSVELVHTRLKELLPASQKPAPLYD